MLSSLITRYVRLEKRALIRSFSKNMDGDSKKKSSDDFKKKTANDRSFSSPSKDVLEKDDVVKVIEKYEVRRASAPDYENPDLTDDMKERLDIMYMYRDTAPMMDSAWRNEIHPKLDGMQLDLTMDATLTGNEKKGLSLKMEAPRYTKVKLGLPLAAFDLKEDEMKILLQLVAPRYKKGKNEFYITSDRYRTRVLNHKHICTIVTDLINAAVEEAKLQQEEQAAAAAIVAEE